MVLPGGGDWLRIRGDGAAELDVRATLRTDQRLRFKNKLFSLDATIVELCLEMFDWARYRQTKGAIKLHVLLDHDGYLPVYAHVTERNVAEMILPFCRQSVYT